MANINETNEPTETTEVVRDEYQDLDECIAVGEHLTDCDDDGYCNYCGDDTPITARYTTTFTYDAQDDRDAANLLDALTDAMATSDALPAYGTTGFTNPRLHKTWPDNDTDRTAMRDWQCEVSNGDTLLGFRDWQAAQAEDTGLDG